jgi:hypothetical protein
MMKRLDQSYLHPPEKSVVHVHGNQTRDARATGVFWTGPLKPRTEVVQGAVHVGKIPVEVKIHEPMELIRKRMTDRVKKVNLM